MVMGIVHSRVALSLSLKARHGKNEFNLHVDDISSSYERMGIKPRFEKEAKGNSEMIYFVRLQTTYSLLKV